MPVIYPLLRVFVGRRINPSKQSSTPVEAGYRKEPLRPRHKFSQLNEESYVSYFQGDKPGDRNSKNNSFSSEDNPDIPMGRILVTRKLSGERTAGI